MSRAIIRDDYAEVISVIHPIQFQHIISNAEYYGPSLFLLATDVVNGYIFQEPSLLSSLQDSGLTDVVLHALLVKDVSSTHARPPAVLVKDVSSTHACTHALPSTKSKM